MAHLYEFTDWEPVAAEPGQLSYRPSGRTFVRRLGGTLVAALIIGGMVLSFGFPPGVGKAGKQPDPAAEAQVRAAQQSAKELEQSVRDMLTEERWQAVQETAAQKQAERAAEREAQGDRMEAVGSIGRQLYWLVLGVCALGGVLSPLSGLWQRISIGMDVRGDLRVTRRGLRRSHRSYAQRRLSDMSVVVAEVIHRSRYGERFVGWRWQVQLRCAAQGGGEDTLIVFIPDLTPTLPPRLEQLTRRVRDFVRGLEQITGLTAAPPMRLRQQTVRRGLFGRGVRVTPVDEPAVQIQKQTYQSLDEVPAHLRAEAERLLAEARRSPDGTAGTSAGVFRYRDSAGNEQVFNSLEEMPPEMRAQFEEMRRRAQEKGS